MYRGKILAITDAPFSFTGYGNQADKILTELVKRGWDVYAFAGNYFPSGKEKKDENGYLIYKGIKIILLPNIWKGSDYLYPSKEEVKEWNDKIQPDIVWSLNDFYRVEKYLELGQEFVDKWVHWLPIDCEENDDFWPLIEKKMTNLVYLSKFGLKKDGTKVGDIHYKGMIYHGVRDDVFKPLPNKYEIKQQHGMVNDFVILTVGKHQPRKMIYHTAHAVCRFIKKVPQAYWVCKCDPHDTSMRGNPDSEADLEKIVEPYGVKDRVMFVTTALPDEQMNNLYNTADVFIHLSGGEGFGIPYVESMLAGTPCILSNNTTSPELTNNGKHGLLVKTEGKKYLESVKTCYGIASLDDAVDCLITCYEDWLHGHYAMLGKMSVEGRDFATKNCTVSKVVDQWEEVFEKMIRYNNKVLWHSFFGKGVGFTSVSEAIIPELQSLGYDLYVNDWMGGSSPILEERFKALYQKYLESRTKINFKDYPQVLCWLMEVFNSIDGDYKIGWSLVESTKLRSFYTDQCNGMQYIVTSTEHNREIQKKSGIINPIYLVPPCVDTNKFHEVERPTFDETKPFTFLHIGVVQERKNPEQALDGYCAAFPDDGKTKFILKSNDFGELETYFKPKYGHRKDIEFIYTKTPLSNEELLNLYARADCYVNLSHGEGIGMPDLEALATGLPVIGSNWDARGSFLDEKVGWMVKIVGFGRAYNHVQEDCGEWAYYDGQDYINILKYVASHPSEARTKGHEGAERVKNEFNPRKAALALDNLFMDVYAKKRAVADSSKFGENYYVNVHKYTPEWHEGVAQAIMGKCDGLKGKVIDMGCGRGYLMKHLLAHGIDVEGIEISEYAVKNPMPECEGKIHLGDATKMQYADKTFDWGISFSVLEHIPERLVDDVLSEISRTCKKAYLGIAIPQYAGHEDVLRTEDSTHITLHPAPWWKERISRAGLRIISEAPMEFIVESKKYEPTPIKNGDRVLIGIPTKDRKDSLNRLMDSVIAQTYKEIDVVIVDDSRYDHINEDAPLAEKCKKMYGMGRNVLMVRGKEINQAAAHNQILDYAVDNGYKMVYRVDDDLTLEPDNIEKLIAEFVKDEKCQYAAIGGMIYNPHLKMDEQKMPEDWKKRVEFAGTLEPCVYWAQVLKYTDEIESRDDIQHLYSSYIYRPELLISVGGFPSDLSPVASREETLPLYELWLKKYKLKIVTKATAYHYCEGHGGCRSVDQKIAADLYIRDESTFRKRVENLRLKYA